MFLVFCNLSYHLLSSELFDSGLLAPFQDLHLSELLALALLQLQEKKKRNINNIINTGEQYGVYMQLCLFIIMHYVAD